MIDTKIQVNIHTFHYPVIYVRIISKIANNEGDGSARCVMVWRINLPAFTAQLKFVHGRSMSTDMKLAYGVNILLFYQL